MAMKRSLLPRISPATTPLLFLLLAYMGGIFTATWLISTYFLWMPIGLLILYKNRVYGLWFLLGVGATYFSYPSTLKLENREIEAYRGYVHTLPTATAGKLGYRFVLHSQAYFDGEKIYACDEKVLVHLYSYRSVLRVGEEVWIRGRPTHFPSGYYAEYWAHQGVFLQDYTGLSDINKTYRTKHTLWYFAQRKRAEAISRLEERLSSSGAALAKGILFGDKSGLSPEIKQSFSASGLMHILAVSGLHVGILYGVWLFLTLAIPLGRYTWHIRIVLGVVLLWCFACVVGLSPSIVRAATLCTLLVLSTLVSRRGASLNALAAAALLILLIQPTACFMLSFQFSFLATLGIGFVYDLIRTQLPWRHTILRYIWNLIALSVSAQVAVLPLSVYYFRLVSCVFLLGNLVIVPSLTFILPFIAATTYLPESLAKYAAHILEALLEGMQWIVIRLASLPGAYFYPVYWSKIQVCALYAAGGFVLLFLYKRHIHYVYGLLLCVLIHGSVSWTREWRVVHEQALRIYMKDQKEIFVQYLDQGHVWCNYQPEKISDAVQSAMQEIRLGFLPKEHRHLIQIVPLLEGKVEVAQVGRLRMAWIQEEETWQWPEKLRLEVDILILSTKKAELPEYIDTQVLLLLPSQDNLPASLTTQAEQRGIKTYVLETEHTITHTYTSKR